jgi:acyl carrier protein
MNDPMPQPVSALVDFIDTTYAPATSVTNDTELVRSEIVDSYGILELITFIETRFDLKIPDEDVRPNNFRTVDAMCAMISRLRSEDDAA